ncbi:HNH endonuclease [Algoriphagus chordae]|uniref:HNH endonuclease n=1 Tax=Algoriphagus chordae TaxID=237019 RepID=A0A2W7SXK2_9BACT|nr:HNH endonuclease [Algoriphagus chordae]PZX55532.1 hypothetical protein LV85_00756 [Algoriphagus chordae]
MTDTITVDKQAYYLALEDHQWKRLRMAVLDRDGHQCRLCASKSQLQVHHRQYHRYKHSGEWLKPWEYHPALLVTLCGTCHEQGHSQYSIPIKEIIKKTQL